MAQASLRGMLCILGSCLGLALGVCILFDRQFNSFTVIERNIAERHFPRDILVSQINDAFVDPHGSLTSEQATFLKNKLAEQ